MVIPVVFILHVVVFFDQPEGWSMFMFTRDGVVVGPIQVGDRGPPVPTTGIRGQFNRNCQPVAKLKDL